MKHYLIGALLAATLSANAQNTPVSQMEKLDRGVVALPTTSGKGKFVSWRLLGTDDPTRTSFSVLRNGTLVRANLKVTCYEDASGTNTSKYQIVTYVDGEPVDTSKAVQAWDKAWLKLPLDRPAGGSFDDGAYTYSPNDCSVGDVDGDGEYELFVKWDPSNAHDNSHNGYTGNVLIDCYKFDGTKLWRIDLGRNIRAGAHYTQFMVYDFDGDGKAEMICKTAPGSKDAAGEYVNQATDNENIKMANNQKVWLNSSGRVDGGHEYLTVFNGLTGKAVNTIAYNPNRNTTSALSEADGTFNWAIGKTDNHGYNRGDRYLAAVAYLDGPEGKPSGIFCRGYYSYAFIWAVDFDGQKLIPRWLHRSDDNSSATYRVVTYDANGTGTTQKYSAKASTSGGGSKTMFGNGNHNMSIADVDGDGRDEIIWGSATLNADGTLRYATGFGHGDAIHIGKMIAGRDGLQVFQVHEEGGTYAWDLHDANTGEILQKGGPSGVDNGRGMAAQLTAKTADWWCSSASDRNQRSAATGTVSSAANGSLNFRMYWDGTVQDGLLDGNKIDKYNDASDNFSRLVEFYNIGPGSTCNGSKNTPNLSADIFGDWREEIILYSVSDEETYLGVYSTNIVTKYAVPTLMHDHTYRMAICWQNTAYNQPPHLGYNLKEATAPHLAMKEMEIQEGESMELVVSGLYVNSLKLGSSIDADGTEKSGGVPAGFTSSRSVLNKTVTIKGMPEKSGDYKFIFQLGGLADESVNDTLTLHVKGTTGIENVNLNNNGNVNGNWNGNEVYTVSGHLLPAADVANLPEGIYIIKRKTGKGVKTIKVVK